MSYPQCDKLAAVSDERRAIFEFVEWAVGAGRMTYTCPTPLDGLIYEFFGIDYWALDAERKAILAAAQVGEQESAGCHCAECEPDTEENPA